MFRLYSDFHPIFFKRFILFEYISGCITNCYKNQGGRIMEKERIERDNGVYVIYYDFSDDELEGDE